MKRLSECAIWPALERHYLEAGPKAWDRLPFHATSNPALAEGYADLILALLHDGAADLDRGEPVYVLELGAGTGCFSFYLLERLFERKRSFAVRYVASDVAGRNVRACRGHPKLRRFREAGQLDFATFSARRDASLRLLESGRLLGAGSLRNPLLVIANYVFDSLPLDVFRVERGKLQEVRFEFPGRPRLDRLRFTESVADVDSDYYADPSLNGILEEYRRRLRRATVPFPIGSFEVIANLRRFSEQGLILLCSDKGFVTPEPFTKLRTAVAAHDGVISSMVNFHALERFVSKQGGSFFAGGEGPALYTGIATVLPKRRSLRRTRAALRRTETRRREISELRASVERDRSRDPDAALKRCLDYLRRSGFDPIAFGDCAERLCRFADGASRSTRSRLLRAIENVRGNFYGAQQDVDVFYWSGKVLLMLDRLDEALRDFRESARRFGAGNASLYYIALCHELRGDRSAALSGYRRALALEPRCAATRVAFRRLCGRRP